MSPTTLDQPQGSRPPPLLTASSAVNAGQRVLREALHQFTSNLSIFLRTDNPEVVHQARIGWRRFKSALRLFRPVLDRNSIPDFSPLQPLLNALGQLRDLDVALTETLPLIASDYVSADLDRQLIWNTFEHSLMEAAQIQRKVVRRALRDSVVDSTQLGIVRYVEKITPADAPSTKSNARRLKPWAIRRLDKFQNELEQAIESATDDNGQHRTRILAKRLRYCLESLQSLLPKRRFERQLNRATALQGTLGLRRDFHRTYLFATELGVQANLVEFLRGYGCGIEHVNAEAISQSGA